VPLERRESILIYVSSRDYRKPGRMASDSQAPGASE
jgi:hypothetical protein